MLQNLLLWSVQKKKESPSVAKQSGTIQAEIGDCVSLEVVDMSMNLLTGRIPDSNGNLTSLQLQELQLSMNRISGEIPPSIGNCRGLTHIELDELSMLYLWQNNLEGSIITIFLYKHSSFSLIW